MKLFINSQKHNTRQQNLLMDHTCFESPGYIPMKSTSGRGFWLKLNNCLLLLNCGSYIPCVSKMSSRFSIT